MAYSKHSEFVSQQAGAVEHEGKWYPVIILNKQPIYFNNTFNSKAEAIKDAKRRIEESLNYLRQQGAKVHDLKSF